MQRKPPLMGQHHSRHAGDDTRRMRTIALAVIVPTGLITLLALIWLWPCLLYTSPSPRDS